MSMRLHGPQLVKRLLQNLVNTILQRVLPPDVSILGAVVGAVDSIALKPKGRVVVGGSLVLSRRPEAPLTFTVAFRPSVRYVV